MRFRWGDCEVDREARRLSRAGAPVPTQPLVLDLLLLLLQHRGRVVSEEVIRRELWPSVRVTDASVRRVLKESRRLIGDDGATQGQIETVRGRGIRFVAGVTIEDGFDTGFVGRADVLDALEQKLEEVASGVGGVTLLHGSAGIGKTRTVAELAARAHALGFRVLHGSGRAGAQEDAFHPWLDAAREIENHDLEARDGNARGVHGATADARRFGVYRAFVQSLIRISREHPVLIALDDLQLADHDAIELLRFVAPAIVAARIWVLASYRSSGGRAAGSQLRKLASIAAESSTQAIELGGLAAKDLRALVRNQLRAEVGERLGALLAERTGGNPLFALEIARSLHRDEQSLEADPTADLEASLGRGIEPLVARRLAALSSETQRLLRAASVLGTEFDSALLQAAENCASRLLTRALDEAMSADLLVRRGDGRWRFTHPLFAEALYFELESEGDGAAASQHLRVAEALERRGSTDTFLVARHFRSARTIAGAERVLRHSHAAADEAGRRSAFADAEVWYRESIELAEEARVTPTELCDLYLGLGSAMDGSSGVYAARESFERAAVLAEQIADRRRLATAALGYAHRPFAFGASTSALRWLRAAHAAPTGDVTVDARVDSRLAAELFGTGPSHVAEAELLFASSKDAARAQDDVFVLGRVLADFGASQFRPKETRAWLALQEEIESLARDSGDREIEFRAMLARATGHLVLGERDPVDSLLGCVRQFANDNGVSYTWAVARQFEAMSAHLDGRFADARAAIEAAERENRSMFSVGIAIICTMQRFAIAVEEKRVGELLPALAAAKERFPTFTSLSALVANANALCDQIGAARTALDAVVEDLPTLVYDGNRLPTLVLAAEAAWCVSDREAAAALEPHLEPYADLSAVTGNASAYLGSVSQALGWLAAARGDNNAALDHFRSALRTHQALRSPTWCKRSADAIAQVTDGRVVLLRA